MYQSTADGEEEGSASSDGTDSDEELRPGKAKAPADEELQLPASPERPLSLSIRRKSSGMPGQGDAGGGGDTLEIYYR